MAQDSVFERQAQIADISALTKEERIKYDSSIKQYRDALSVYEGASLSRRAEGLQEGIKQGEARGIISTARNTKSKGLSIDFIMEITGLSSETIGAL